MKKHEVKYNRKEIIVIAFVWLFVLSMIYVVYLKMRLL